MTFFRCIQASEATLTVDFNHPLSQNELSLTAILHQVEDKQGEKGGKCINWVEIITGGGTGFQVRYQSQPTDFFSDDPFNRMEENNNGEITFLPSAIDAKATEIIVNFYEKLFKPKVRTLETQMRVLELCSSEDSYTPESLTLRNLTRLKWYPSTKNNSGGTCISAHDLNTKLYLPFEAQTFDAVICTAVVEYLIHPFEIFQDVARILKEEGYFIVTFSNRWFPPKVIKIWQQIHEFERMGLVLEYFLRTKQYKNLKTYSVRNFPRPLDDKYINETMLADPVFIVYGQKA
jgi:SAM-dependent methyltransferase